MPPGSRGRCSASCACTTAQKTLNFKSIYQNFISLKKKRKKVRIRELYPIILLPSSNKYFFAEVPPCVRAQLVCAGRSIIHPSRWCFSRCPSHCRSCAVPAPDICSRIEEERACKGHTCHQPPKSGGAPVEGSSGY